MSTLAEAKRERFRQRVKWTLIVVALIAIITFLTGSKFGAVIEGLTPPTLPKPAKVTEQVWLDQNWDPATREQYHHISQGTRTLPIPYPWFVGLERPAKGLFGILFSSDQRLADNDYLLRFGFIKGTRSEYNPDALPVGFALTPNQNLPGLTQKEDAIGLTCAACHTGQLVHDGKQYVIDGGPAQTDLGQLTKALGAALGQTAISSKLPLFNGRFDRFARNVLGAQYSDTTKEQLAAQLAAVVAAGLKVADTVAVNEGFTRVDALNRIGNQVFHKDIDRPENYAPINAPVNYPHIWTSSWFDWVQYDGSIMQPLIRNAGEALGVNALLDTDSPKGEGRFSSSIPMRDLAWIEDRLAGDRFGPEKQYNGLGAPRWPAAFGEIDTALAAKGEGLYALHCEGCHLPPLDSPRIWEEQNFRPIRWTDIKGEKRQTAESVLHVKIIAQEQIGTDAAQGNVLVQRMVDTAGRDGAVAGEASPGMGLDANLCTHAPKDPGAEWSYDRDADDLVTVPFKDGGNVLFGLALGATVQQTIEAWFADNYISAKQQAMFQGDRPNCLQVGAGYRARPLNGVWATAPFLHNGAVPTLMDLLSPVAERPTLVQLGATTFDTEKVGIVQDPNLRMEAGRNYARNGLFILDTSIPGNHNAGHEFSEAWIPTKKYDQQPKGVIGPKLSMDERRALVEYLKTL